MRLSILSDSDCTRSGGNRDVERVTCDPKVDLAFLESFDLETDGLLKLDGT